MIEWTGNTRHPRAAYWVAADFFLCKVSYRVYAERVYQKALSNLQVDPENSNAQIFALERSQQHYSAKRPDGALTIYDEQAIQ